MKMELPVAVDNIIRTLNEAGYEAYAVGGCVRDSILGVSPKDWDITTSAKPEETKALFSRTIDTGIQHGTITIMVDKEGYEVTTYRVDGEYEDGRHPKEVVFTANLEEDLKRRDFTINAMAYHPKEGLVDIFGGIKDLQEGSIRCVGNAMERFTEDALRILRAVRFSAQLGFDIEPKTKEAMRELAPRLQMISAERICAELWKLLQSPHPDYLTYAYETGVTKEILPDLLFFKDETRIETLKKLAENDYDLWVRLTILFVNLLEGTSREKSERVEKILRGLKTDLYTIKLVGKLALLEGEELEASPAAVRTFLSKFGQEVMERWLLVKEVQEKRSYDNLRGIMERVLERGECISIKQLAVDGKDLLALGVKQGKNIGEILAYLLGQVIEEPEKNNRETLLEIAKERIE